MTIFDPVDFGVPQLGLTYVVNDDTLEEKSDVIERFVAATLRAVEFAMENEEATLDIILEFAPLEDREHQRFMLRQELASAESDVTAQRGVGDDDRGAVAGALRPPDRIRRAIGALRRRERIRRPLRRSRPR